MGHRAHGNGTHAHINIILPLELLNFICSMDKKKILIWVNYTFHLNELPGTIWDARLDRRPVRNFQTTTNC